MQFKGALFFSVMLVSVFVHAETVQCQGKDIKITMLTSTNECYAKPNCPEATVLEVTCQKQTLAAATQIASEPLDLSSRHEPASTSDIDRLKSSVVNSAADSYRSNKMKGFLATLLTAKSLNSTVTMTFEKRLVYNGHPAIDAITLE